MISTLFILPALKFMIKEESSPNKYLSKDDRFYDLLKVNESIYVQLNREDEFSKFANDSRPEFVRCLVEFCKSFNDYSDDEDKTSLLPTAYLINDEQHSSKLASIQGKLIDYCGFEFDYKTVKKFVSFPGANALVLIDPDNRTKICKAVLI